MTEQDKKEAERLQLCMAAIKCPHEIVADRFILHYDDKQPGKNALAQLADRLSAALRAEQQRTPLEIATADHDANTPMACYAAAMAEQQGQKPVAYLVSVEGEPDLGHWFAEEPDPIHVCQPLYTRPAPASQPVGEAVATDFQRRVRPWMLACFGAEIAADVQERNHRFLEEALELVQACGATASEAHQLVDYVYGRPAGEKVQEVGGVMVTLAALCLAQGIDMHAAGETELGRIWTKVEQIRAKQAAKPKHSPLPEHAPSVAQTGLSENAAMDIALRIIANLEDRAGVLDGVDDDTKADIADEIAVAILACSGQPAQEGM